MGGVGGYIGGVLRGVGSGVGGEKKRGGQMTAFSFRLVLIFS